MSTEQTLGEEQAISGFFFGKKFISTLLNTADLEEKNLKSPKPYIVFYHSKAEMIH